jgi:release factor glutamine methyltransferase
MLLSEIRSLFNKNLNSLYPLKEIESIFSIAVEHTLKYSKIDIHQNLHKSIQPEDEKKILETLFRLKQCEPIQYITGFTEFYGLKFFVDQRVLIPRQETEMLVDIVLKDKDRNSNIIDLCTGSGCIAISIAKNLIKANVTANDISRQSLDVAIRNAKENKCEIQFIQDNILQPNAIYKKYDCIVSNPPYIRNSEKVNMHKNVLDYEPAQALFVDDNDPLIFYRAIAIFAQNQLISGGKIYLEINEYLWQETKELMEEYNFCEVQIIKDLENKNRFLQASK